MDTSIKKERIMAFVLLGLFPGPRQSGVVLYVFKVEATAMNKLILRHT